MNQHVGLFFNGQIMLNTQMLINWETVVNRILPNTSGALNTQFQTALNTLTTLLNATPNSQLATNKIIVPIKLVNELKYAFATYDYQFGMPAFREYGDTEEELHSVFDAYAIAYYNGDNPKTVIIY